MKRVNVISISVLSLLVSTSVYAGSYLLISGSTTNTANLTAPNSQGVSYPTQYWKVAKSNVLNGIASPLHIDPTNPNSPFLSGIVPRQHYTHTNLPTPPTETIKGQYTHVKTPVITGTIYRYNVQQAQAAMLVPTQMIPTPVVSSPNAIPTPLPNNTPSKIPVPLANNTPVKMAVPTPLVNATPNKTPPLLANNTPAPITTTTPLVIPAATQATPPKPIIQAPIKPLVQAGVIDNGAKQLPTPTVTRSNVLTTPAPTTPSTISTKTATPATTNTITKTITVIDTVKGDKGDVGATGKQGVQGVAGKQGLAGVNTTRIINTSVVDTKTRSQVVNNTQSIQKMNNSFSSLKHEVDDNHKQANAGISGAMAMAGIPQVQANQKVMFGAGAATYNGESALAVGASVNFNDHVVGKVSFSDDTANNMGASVGVGVGF